MKYLKLRNLLGIATGSALVGFGINYFNIANHLAEGGITGVAILLKLGLDLNPGLTTLVLNVPLLVLGWRVLGRSAVVATLLGIASLSVSLWLFGRYRLPLADGLLASLYAGVTTGIGLGVVFRFGGTTGGVDILARVFHKLFGWKLGRTIFIADLAVIAASLLYLKPEQAMYTLVAVFVGTRVVDFAQDAAYSARAALVVTDQPDVMAHRIVEEMNRGVTFLQGRGGYSGVERKVLYIVVGRSELTRLKQIIDAVDPGAFVSITEASEVLGEGFTHDRQKQPLEA